MRPAAGYNVCMATVLNRSDDHRERWADELLDRLTPAMSALGILFVLVIVGEQLARPDSMMSWALTVLGWLLWAVFVAEFAARLAVAPDSGRFMRRNWWQLLFLVLPFLRVFRLARAVKVLRTGRVLSGAVRGSRSAGQVLRSRLGWLASLWLISVLSASQLLYAFSDFATFADALHATALAAISGEPLAKPDAFARIAEVLLAAFSVAVFGTLAGTVGAFFLHDQGAEPSQTDHSSGQTQQITAK